MNVTLRLLNELQEGEISPNELIYNELLSVCYKLKLYLETVSFFYGIVKNGYWETLKMLIFGLCDKGEKYMAKAVFCTSSLLI